MSHGISGVIKFHKAKPLKIIHSVEISNVSATEILGDINSDDSRSSKITISWNFTGFKF